LGLLEEKILGIDDVGSQADCIFLFGFFRELLQTIADEGWSVLG